MAVQKDNPDNFPQRIKEAKDREKKRRELFFKFKSKEIGFKEYMKAIEELG